MLRVAIVGVGLIGGSLGQAWRRAKAAHVVGIARRAETIDEALACEALDEGTTDLAEGVATADVVVICTPVTQIAPMALAAAPHLLPGTVVTDVGSTKGELCRTLWSSLPEHIVFIGGHPMAGSERPGVGAADPYLYENAVYCLTPPGGMSLEHPALRRLLSLVQATGARPLVLDAQTHDLIVAGVSHLPHIVAAALVNTVAACDTGDIPMLQLASGGFRDTTRIASGSAEIWRDICLTNRRAILHMLTTLEVNLDGFRQALIAEDTDGLTGLLDQASRTRATVPMHRRGMLGGVHEITVILVDRPGAIHAVSGLLAEASLNIIDIEIMRVREGEGGTVRIAFSADAEAEKAVRLLCDRGYVARRR